MANSLPPIARPEPTPPGNREPAPKFEHPAITNELTMLGQFILENAVVEFDIHLGALIQGAGEMHDLYAGNCRADHMYTDVPCDEYERNIALGIAWLMARIRQGGSNAS